MGKKAKAKSPTATPEAVDTERATEVAELKRSGDEQFAEREYQKALDTYDKAVKMLPDSSSEKADILSNKAACYLQMKRFKEAVRECSAALTSSPGFSKALVRRSRAYENQGLFKQALTDIEKVNRSEASSPETKEIEKRLKDIVAGRRPAGAPAPRNAAARVPPIVYFTAKCTFEDETRTVHLSHATSYAELLDVVRAKFASIGPFLIKYKDKDGDLVTISERSDVANAISEALAAYEKKVSTHSSRLNPQFPPVKFTIVKAESEEEVPVPPEEEVRERKQFIANQKALEKARTAKLAEKRGDAAAEEGYYEIDDWLVDFANLFRERTGIDPDRHVDMHNLGVEKCQKALESVIHSPEAIPIFDEAAEKFKEVTCVGLLNWGNVYLCVGHKLGSEAASQGKPADEVEADILEYFDKAEDRYNEAMKYKEDFYDGILALAQLEFERAKVKMGLIVEPPEDPESKRSEEEAETPPTKVPPKKPPTAEAVDEEKTQHAAAQAMNEAMKKALARVDASKLPIVQPLIDKSWEIYAKSVALGIDLDAQREKEKEKKAAKEKAKGGAQTESKADEGKDDGQEEPGLKTHALVMWGNVIFEQSQILAATGGDWKQALDEAVTKFREAGCNEKDINQALRTHFKADELDIPKDDPEEDAPAGPAKEEAQAPVKGLPSLGPKPKKPVEA